MIKKSVYMAKISHRGVSQYYGLKEIAFIFASSQDALFSWNNTSNYSYPQMNTCYMNSWREGHSRRN